MSVQSPPLQQRSLSVSSASSSSSSSDHSTSHPAHNASMDRRRGSMYSQSSPELLHQLDGAGNSSEPTHLASGAHPPRTHSHGAVASHFLAQPPDAYGGQTWMDFLREAGTDSTVNAHHSQQDDNPLPPLPPEHYAQASSSRLSLPAHPALSHDSSSHSSSDRKRRLTTSESPQRRTSHMRMHAGNTGDSISHPIILDSSPVPARPPLPPSFSSQSGMATRRRESDIVLPPWQPDSEVTHCLVCGSQFTFFYRKHHCRKCGRVVCSACSPHRITIPRQFIVYPPNENPDIIDLTIEDDDNTMSAFGPFRNPALGGGEEVRVCNPCVPDPNYDPPPPYTQGQALPYQPFSPGSHTPHLQRRGLPLRMHSSTRGHRPSQSVNDGAQTVGYGQTSRPRDPFTDRRVSFHGSTRVADLWPPTQPPHPGHGNPPGYDYHALAHSRPTAVDSSSPGYPPPDSRDHPDPSMFRRSLLPHGRSRPTPPQPAPRRQIAEEDECPICGNELPAKLPNDDDSARTQHVEECIALHSASPPPPSNAANQTSTSLPSQRTRGMSNPSGNGEGASNSNRLSMSARGMYPYTATEKDCVNDEGDEAECVICFEEFEAGDKMARLVCWCKFHEACIRQWWEKKGRGACPTHQLQY